MLTFLWNVAVLYFTLGFRQFSHYFTDIHLALNNDDVPRARNPQRMDRPRHARHAGQRDRSSHADSRGGGGIAMFSACSSGF
ncbi:MAG: Similar to cobalamin biosynthesis protein CbiB [uncultured Paraburkholderia sp.]|nr:MAG: Similar to cobalamin biosynthesis protein CbiB [uncultured Paraburkholderia sp.]CAH2943958.1 MAG: Similar to cobalamin biosynthesis protein CbiB [uncultured Paraburkholderia sp.]